ncbi:hypothetical protein TrLO_g11245 [Triparma laevis f. longispina]|uniref:Tetratricopeptide repeat protein n=1 Tax=Triparma laevis f. longispina TaxID=1714387 RepID=A0A9W7E8S9_9STRA|nr:hypothetical protein TrLO_g11245 [Triparma laevis f. longispina]
MSESEKIEKLRGLVKRVERVLGEENFTTLETLNTLGNALQVNEENEEAKEVFERCLAGRLKVLGEYHNDTNGALNNLENVHDRLGNYEKDTKACAKNLKICLKLRGKRERLAELISSYPGLAFEVVD